MKVLLAAGTLCAILFFLLLSGFFKFFQVQLMYLRYKLTDKHYFENFCSDKYSKRLVKNADLLYKVFNFGMLFCSTCLGLLVIPSASWVVFDDALPIEVSILFIFILLILAQILFNTTLGAIAAYINPLRTLQVLAKVLYFFGLIFSPLIIPFQLFANAVTKLFKKNKQSLNDLDTYDAILQLNALSKGKVVVSPYVLNIIKNTLTISELEVTDALLPRKEIQFFDVDKPIQENLKIAKEAGYTRYPLCKGTIDHCIGIIHIKDVFLYQGSIETLDLTKFKRPLITFSEDTALENALEKLLRFRIHMALVVDEFGSVIGAVTLENLLEQVVGAIHDEFDKEESLIIALADNTYKVLGLAPLHELEKALGIVLEDDNKEDVSTFGGLVSSELGRIPEKDERLQIGPLSIRVDEVSKQRLISAIVQVIEPKVLEEEVATDEE